MPVDKTASHIKIVAAAKKEFLEYGFKDASLRRIADAAGISVSGLYKHFPSKEDMFASLVDPVLDGFWDLYYGECDTDFQALDQNNVGRAWEDAHQTIGIMKYVYAHYDEFKLIICRSQGTRYDDFLHEMALREEQSTLSFLDGLKQRGIAVSPVRAEEFHLLVTTNVDAVFQTVLHDFPEEQAMHYADTLDRFFMKGWRDLFGV